MRQIIIWTALSTVTLFYFSWPPLPAVFLLFVAIVPLFLAYHKLPFWSWLLAVFLTLFGWNTSTTYWLYNTLPVGSFFVHIINSIIFSLPFVVFWLAEKRFNRSAGYLNFAFAWLSLEYLQLNWDLGYSFMNLGNGVSMYPEIFQWYEYTGALGGSLWILVINILASELCLYWIHQHALDVRKLISLTAVLLIPLVFSIFRYNTYQENGKTCSVAIVSPAIDCYNEKYQKDLDWLTDTYLLQCKEINNPDFILWPETAIPDAGLSDALNENPFLEKIRNGLNKSTNSSLITGAIIYKKHGFDPEEKANKTYYQPLNEYLSTHNSAIEIKRDGPIRIIRTKMILVPFEETVPYPKLLGWLRKMVGTLGGFTFSYLDEGAGFVQYRETKATPLICYETVGPSWG